MNDTRQIKENRFQPGDKVIAACLPSQVREVINLDYDERFGGWQVLVSGALIYAHQQNFILVEERELYNPVYDISSPLWGYWVRKVET